MESSSIEWASMAGWVIECVVGLQLESPVWNLQGGDWKKRKESTQAFLEYRFLCQVVVNVLQICGISHR